MPEIAAFARINLCQLERILSRHLGLRRFERRTSCNGQLLLHRSLLDDSVDIHWKIETFPNKNHIRFSFK